MAILIRCCDYDGSALRGDATDEIARIWADSWQTTACDSLRSKEGDRPSTMAWFADTRAFRTATTTTSVSISVCTCVAARIATSLSTRISRSWTAGN